MGRTGERSPSRQRAASAAGTAGAAAARAALALLAAIAGSLVEATPSAASAAARVDSARIEAIVRSLSQTADGAPASRYAERPETRFVHAPLVRDSLNAFYRASVGGDIASLVGFRSERTDTEQVNVVGIRPADGPSAGLLLLTGHLDTTGRRTVGWDGLRDPAPGADDNASGIACLLEAARVFAGPEAPALPFDLGFVAFAAEELFGPPGSAPLEGSRVLARALEDSGVVLLGAINCDMVAYNPDRRAVDLVTNAASAWLAELVRDAAFEAAPDLEVTPVLNESALNSDHASFWGLGEDAVTAIENPAPDIPSERHPGNPFYHTVDDTVGNVDFGLAADVARAVVAAVERLAETPAGPPDLVVEATHLIVSPREVFAGDAARVEVRVYNRGGAVGEGAAPAQVRLEWSLEGGPSRAVGEGTVSLPIRPWFYARLVLPWAVAREDVGTGRLTATVSAPGLAEATTANNVAARALIVQRNAVSALRPSRNPMLLTESPDRLRFDFDAPIRPGDRQDVEAIVFDVSGRRIGFHPREGAQDGRNYLLWTNFRFEDGEAPPSGVYVVEVRLLDRASGTLVSSAATKFTLLR